MGTSYGGHCQCIRCGQYHWIQAPCPVESTALEQELDKELGIPPPKLSPKMIRKVKVFRRKRFVMRILEKLPFFSE